MTDDKFREVMRDISRRYNASTPKGHGGMTPDIARQALSCMETAAMEIRQLIEIYEMERTRK